MPYGLLSTGFAIKPQAQVLADIQSALLAQISAALNLQAPDPIAVVSGIVSAAVAELWLAVGALYSGMDPDIATGDQETGLALITGTVRQPATYSLIPNCTVNVNAGFSQAPGTMLATLLGNPSVLFTNQATVASAGGGNVTVNFVAVNSGPQGLTTIAPSTLSVISQPVAGWNSVTNGTAGIVGSAIQSDSSLRASRNAQLSAAGAGTAASLQGQVLKFLQPSRAPLTVPNVSNNPYTPLVATLAATVLWNDTEVADANTLPPHSIEVIAYAPGFTSPDDKALCAVILAYKAAGITTYNGGGTLVSQATVDSQGTTETILATRPSTQVIAIVITVKTTNPALVTTQQVKDAIATYAAGGLAGANPQLGAWQPGLTAYYLQTQASVLQSNPLTGVPGVIDVTAFTMNAGTSNITATPRQVNTLGTITVTVI